MFSFQIFVGSRRELVANSIHTADATQLDTAFDHKKFPAKQQNSLINSWQSSQNRILLFSKKWTPWYSSR